MSRSSPLFATKSLAQLWSNGNVLVRSPKSVFRVCVALNSQEIEPLTKLPLHSTSRPLWLDLAREQHDQTNIGATIKSTFHDGIIVSHSSAKKLWGKSFSPHYVDQTFLIVIKKDVIFSPAYQLEASFLGFRHFIDNVYSASPEFPIKVAESNWINMAGLKIAFEPLAAGRSSPELISAVTKLNLGCHLSGFNIHYEQTSKLQNGRLPRRDLKKVLSEAIKAGKEKLKPEIDLLNFHSPIFVILETSVSYFFGHMKSASSLPIVSFKNAPHQWSAGLPAPLAASAVNIAASPGETLLDPCCGYGTILFESHRRGIKTFGSDCEFGAVKMAAENLSFFQFKILTNWGPVCSINGPHNPRTCLLLEDRPSTLLGSHEIVESDNSCEKIGEDKMSYVWLTKVDSKENVIQLNLEDAKSVEFKGNAIVANLPFGRFVKVKESTLVEILSHLKGRAERYVFFSGAPLSEILTELGFCVLAEVSPCRRSKRFMSIAVDDEG